MINRMQNFNSNQNYNFSNNVKQFELNEAKKKMGINQIQEQMPVIQQQSNQLNNSNQQQFNTMF
jgi:hypothetical protein